MGKFNDLIITKGLYDPIKINLCDLDEMATFLMGKFVSLNNVDHFCPQCKEKSTFKHIIDNTHDRSINVAYENYKNELGFGREFNKQEAFNGFLNKSYTFNYQCARDKNHPLILFIFVTETEIVKIGQFPSLADLAIEDKQKYKSVLKEQYNEYNRAIGLFAHGIGIGAFVYLRRIIEKLVFNVFTKEKDKLNVSDDEFLKLRFDKKVAALKDYLPNSLTSRTNMYGIISKGIHELGEDECRAMFPLVKTGIELILDDIISAKERAEKEKQLDSFINNKTRELREK